MIPPAAHLDELEDDPNVYERDMGCLEAVLQSCNYTLCALVNMSSLKAAQARTTPCLAALHIIRGRVKAGLETLLLC